MSLKPIFHCDAKYLALGVGVGQCPRCQNFVLEIPTCWYILALPNAKICVFPDANPQRQSVEYIGCVWPCTFHGFCVDLICVWCPTRTPFPVEYGLKARLKRLFSPFNDILTYVKSDTVLYIYTVCLNA